MDRCTSAPWHRSQSGSRLIDHGAAPSSPALAPQKSALVVRGPQEVKKRELVFLQLSLNGSSEDFSAIRYLLFSSFRDFMQRCGDLGTPGGGHQSEDVQSATHLPSL